MKSTFVTDANGFYLLEIQSKNSIAKISTGISSEDYFPDYTRKKLKQFQNLACSYASLLLDRDGFFTSEQIMKYMRFKTFCFGNKRILDQKDRFLVNLLEKVCLAI